MIASAFAYRFRAHFLSRLALSQRGTAHSALIDAASADDKHGIAGDKDDAEDEAVRLPDLPAELLVAIATELTADDELAASLACRKLREAVAGTERRAAGARLSTTIGSVFGSLAKLEWVITLGLLRCADLLNGAARRGLLEHLRSLRVHSCAWEAPAPWRDGPCLSAAGGGHLAVLQWARADGCPWNEWTCARAAEGGHLAVLQWLRANGCPWDGDTCGRAAKGGHLAVLQWARANGCPSGEWVCARAAEGGHLAMLQWARANGCPWGASQSALGERAARGNQVDVLMWLGARGFLWDVATCSSAAEGGHLALLQFLRVMGCPWDVWTCTNAATAGHLAVLQWARANGCPWDWRVRSRAAAGGHTAVLDWARANGCPER
jgi:hypothetical protein